MSLSIEEAIAEHHERARKLAAVRERFPDAKYCEDRWILMQSTNSMLASLKTHYPGNYATLVRLVSGRMP